MVVGEEAILKRKVCLGDGPCQFVGYADIAIRQKKNIAPDGKPYGAGSGRYAILDKQTKDYRELTQEDREHLARLDRIIESYSKGD